jgi:hypothetical protein
LEADMKAMLNFDILIRHFGPRAVFQLCDEAATDNLGLDAMNRRGSGSRVAAIRKWMDIYKVLQGIDAARRDALAKAVLNWADNQLDDSRLETLDALVRAHADLMAACSQADGRGRDFTSLASKALWLRYPDAVPLYDRFAQEALWMLSKLEPNLPPIPKDAPKYGAFTLIWRTLYDRYAPSIAAVDNKGYSHRVRIFDKILWLIGEPVYGYSKPPRS